MGEETHLLSDLKLESLILGVLTLSARPKQKVSSANKYEDERLQEMHRCPEIDQNMNFFMN